MSVRCIIKGHNWQVFDKKRDQEVGTLTCLFCVRCHKHDWNSINWYRD